jgi:hypothetical protein
MTILSRCRRVPPPVLTPKGTANRVITNADEREGEFLAGPCSGDVGAAGGQVVDRFPPELPDRHHVGDRPLRLEIVG